MCIHNSKTRSRIEKGYLLIYILGIISLVTGFFFESAYIYIPLVFLYESGYEEIKNKVRILGTFWKLFLNLGLFLFSLSAFIGGMTDKRVTVEVRRGMLVISVIVSIALVIFNFLSYLF